MNDNTISPPPASTKGASMYGILFAVILILELVISYVMKIGADNIYGTVILVLNYVVLPAIFIYMGCNAFKNANSGFISFGECLKTGVIICLIAGAISAVAGVILNMLFPDYMIEIMEQARHKMLEQNPDMTSDQIKMGLSMMEKFSKPWFTIPVTILMYAFIGLIHSLIIGAIVKKDRPASF